MVFDRTEEVDAYLQFAQLARNSDNHALGQENLFTLLSDFKRKLAKTEG